MADTTTLTAQLRALLLLTQTEEQVARTRVAQARTEAVRRELQQNADNASSRAEEIARTLRDLGGVPDVVTPALGRLGALVKATVEQAGPLDEALLGDLSLEHQLRDRATYLKVLAETASCPRHPAGRAADHRPHRHRRVADRRPRRDRPRRPGSAPGHPAAARHRWRDPAGRLPGPLRRRLGQQGHRHHPAGRRLRPEKIDAATARATTFAGAVRESLTVGRNASLQEAEHQARREGARDTAEAIHETRRELGALEAAELPVDKYDELTVGKAVEAVKKLDDAADLEAVIRYEETHKDRASVVSAAQTQLAALAKEAVGVS